MACYHPLKGFPIGVTKNGKVDYKITGYDAACVVKEGDKVDVYGYVVDSSVVGVSGRVICDYIDIPCGQCIGCRLQRSADWACRCMLESKYHSFNYFFTLTYDDLFVPRSSYIDKDTGELCSINTLYKKDLQNFWKRLRKRVDYKFKYYACGEYGTKTARPHYHAIVFGLEIPDLKLWKQSNSGFNLYTSEWINSIWKKGYVVIGDVTFESCAYVARYIMKKQTGEASSVYDDYNLEPEFNCMSLKPAIGLEYFSDHYNDIYRNDEIILPEGRVVSPPRYFDKKYDLIDEEDMQNIKDKRSDLAAKIKAWKESRTTQSYQELLRSEEIAKKGSIKRLVRPLE